MAKLKITFLFGLNGGKIIRVYQRERSGWAVWRQGWEGLNREEKQHIGYIGPRILNMELSGTRERGRLKRRFMVVVMERWRQMTRCGIFSRERLKENEKMDRNGWNLDNICTYYNDNTYVVACVSSLSSFFHRFLWDWIAANLTTRHCEDFYKETYLLFLMPSILSGNIVHVKYSI